MKNPLLLFLLRSGQNALHNLIRNKPLAIATTLIIALMFFVLNIVLAIHFATDSVLTSLGKKIDIRVEFQDKVEDYSKRSFIQELEQLPEVEEVVFIPREEALKRLGAKYPNILLFLEQNKLKNPLPDVLRIMTRGIEDNPALVTFLQKPEYGSILAQTKLKNDSEQSDRQEKIATITRFLKRIALWLDLTFALVVVLIIFNSISLNIHAHQQEITVMQLVGAQMKFIRGGYLLEGAFYGLFSLVISFVLSRLTVVYLTGNLLGIIQDESLLMGLNSILLHFGDFFWITFFWELVAALIVGLLSSFMAIEMYLIKKQSF